MLCISAEKTYGKYCICCLFLYDACTLHYSEHVSILLTSSRLHFIYLLILTFLHSFLFTLYPLLFTRFLYSSLTALHSLLINCISESDRSHFFLRVMVHREDREGRTVLSHLHVVDLTGELI